MFYNAQNGIIQSGDTDMNYVTFGRGRKNLVLLPGLSDGLTTVKNKALAMAFLYREFAQYYKVYIFSRKNHLEKDYSTKDMARDQAAALKKLGIEKTYLMGVSQGGLISQYLALDYPDLIEKLVLVVTLAKQNETIRKVVGAWIKMAEANDYKSLFIDTAEKSYSERYLKRNRLFFPLLLKFGKPQDFTRFLIQAHACKNHDSYQELSRIAVPTLIIGADNDKVVGSASSAEMAQKIKGSELYIYKGLGHAAYAEAKDFDRRVIAFLER